MIDCYTWRTDCGYKPLMMLEEADLPYRVITIDLLKMAQMTPQFMQISPCHKIPAIVDHEGRGGKTAIWESSVILRYLAEKSGKLYPSGPSDRVQVDQWLSYGSSTFTILAQEYGRWTTRSPVKAPPAQAFYEEKMRDMLRIFDRHLATSEHFAGPYSIADVTLYPDVHMHGVTDIGLDDYPNVKRWHDMIEARPAVQRAWRLFST